MVLRPEAMQHKTRMRRALWARCQLCAKLRGPGKIEQVVIEVAGLGRSLRRCAHRKKYRGGENQEHAFHG